MTTDVFKKENLFAVILKNLIISFIFALGITFAVSLLFGYKYSVVWSGSMEPSLHTYTLVVLAPEKFEEIKEGDIVTFKSGGKGTMSFTHRVKGFTDDGKLITAGDANIDPGTGQVVNDSSFVGKERYVGKVITDIYPIGLIIALIKLNILEVGLILIAGFVIYLILSDKEKLYE